MIVNSNFFTHVKGNQKGKVIAYSCNKTEKCLHFNKGKCVCEYQFLGQVLCPNAKRIDISSPTTSRSVKYIDWKAEMYKEYSTDVLCVNEKLCKVADYMYIPLLYLKNYVNSLPYIENEYFIPDKDFNIDTIQEIVTFKPQALMGGTIRNYQKKEVPKFIRQLKEEFNDLYEEWSKKYKDTAKKYEISASNVGRRAYINTLKQGSKIYDRHDNEWIVDGENIICRQWKTWLPFGETSTIVKIKITDDMIYKVKDDNTTDENTKYVD